MSWDRGAPTPVVQNAHQAKQEPDRGPPWGCPCGHMLNTSTSTHCIKCGMLRPDERFLRMQARATQGLGRGGGYFERGDPADRREASQDEVDGVDEFGRRRKASSSALGGDDEPQAEGSSSSRVAAGSGPRNGLTSTSALPTKAERQKAALERLRNPTKRTNMSPPRTRNYRDRSRSRSREKKKTTGFIISGGIR
mmetsp:Transcript_18225/g.54493  ORF Transcript_18225/g.54493 Transcript_18225/m.54493 type:complete len:195 (-) Transcript_18225:117-701(-)